MANLNLYKFFCSVAEEKNISKASEKLYVSQPAVSFAIRELEQELGQQLFIRKSKGVELTTFGKILYEQIKSSVVKFEQAEQLAKNFKRLEHGIIRIGASTSNVNQILMDYLSIFAKKFPNIQIKMERDDKDNLIEKLKNNQLDLIFIDKIGKLDDFKTIKQFDVKYQLIGNKDYKQKYADKDIDVANFPIDYLILPSINNTSRLTINNFFQNHSITLCPKYELDSYILLYDFVKNGFGIAFVNIEYYRHEVEKGEVFVLYPTFFMDARQIVCLTNYEQTNPALNKMIEIIKNDN